MAKYLAGELCYKCSQYAMKILGAYGYSPEYPVARISATPDLRHGRGFHQHLQVHHGPGPTGDPESKPLIPGLVSARYGKGWSLPLAAGSASTS